MGLFHLSKKSRDRKRKNTFASILAIFLIILFAVPVGLYLSDGFVAKHFARELPDANDLLDNVNNIKYEGKTPDKLSAVDTYLVACKILDDQEYYKITTSGMIDAQLTTQTVSSSFIKDGPLYSCETFSSGMINVASKAEYIENGDVVLFDGKKTSDSAYAWNNNTSVSYDYYKNYYGRDAKSYWSYIVSSKTVLAQTKCSEENGLYTFTISLDPITSTIIYKNAIKLNSGLKSDPEFNSIQITFTVDKDFVFKSLYVKESDIMNYVGVKVTISCFNTPIKSEFCYEK